MSTTEEQRKKDYEKAKRWRLAQAEGKSKKEFEKAERKRAAAERAAARKKKREEQAAARKKKREERKAAQKKRNEEQAAARKKKREEQAAARKKRNEERAAARKKKREEQVAARKRKEVINKVQNTIEAIEKIDQKIKEIAEQNKQFDQFMAELDKKDPVPTHGAYIPSHTRFSNEDPSKSTIGKGKYNKERKDISPSIGYITVQHVPSGRLATFPAFIKGFSDNFNLNWNEEPVYGRMDSLYTYSSTKRSINLSFVIVAERHFEAVKNMQNLDQLVQNLYPAYEVGKGRSSTRLAAAPLLKISWGNLINGGGGRGMLVACNSVGIEHNVEAGFFEHGGNANRKQHIIPKEINVSLSCNVLHDFDLGFKTNGKALERGRRKSNSFYNFPYGFETANVSGEELVSPPEHRPTDQAKKELEKERDKLIEESEYISALRGAINFTP